MIQVKLVTLISLAIIFTSVFFVHFAFNNYFKMTEMCATKDTQYCNQANIFLYFLFSFVVVICFVVVIETTIYLMFREVEMEMKFSSESRKQMKSSIDSLEKRKVEIEKAKEEVQRKFFHRKISEKTFDQLKQKYDTELADVEMEMKEIKKKFSKGWLE